MWRLRSRSLDSYKCGPRPVQILVAVPAGSCLSRAVVKTERVKAAPYNRSLGGWARLGLLTDAGYKYSLLLSDPYLLTFVTENSRTAFRWLLKLI